MIRISIIVLFFFGVFSCSKEQGKNDRIILDSTQVNSTDNSFEYLIQEGEKTIYKYKVLDFSIQASRKYDNQSMIVFEFNDLVSGVNWVVIYYKKDKTLFESEKFDLDAIGEEIDPEKVNLQDLTIQTRIAGTDSFNQVKINPVN